MISRTGRILLVVVALLVGFADAAAAEQPATVVEETAGDGLYVAGALRSSFDEAAWADTIAEAADLGIDLRIIAPFDPVPDTAAFALRVRQLSEADAVLVFDGEGSIQTSVSDDWHDGQYRAVSAARLAADPDEAAAVYLRELTTEPVKEMPGLVRRLATIAFLLTLVVGIATFAELTLRQRRARARAARQSSGASA